jgi:hypothetical protein
MQLYLSFYRLHGMRYPSQLSKPLMSPIDMLHLPAGSLYHCTDDADTAIGATPEDPIMPKSKDPVVVDNVLMYAPEAVFGNPRHVNYIASKSILGYFSAYKNFKKLQQKPALAKNRLVLMVNNYGLANHAYRYTLNYMTPYNQWRNYYTTVMSHVQQCATSYDRQQFIVVPNAVRLPPLSVLQQAEKGNVKPYIQHYKDHASMFLLDMWLFLGEHRKDSVLGQLDAQGMSRLNLVWIIGGQWTVLNLGQLDSWIKPERPVAMDDADGTVAAVEHKPKAVFNHIGIQKRYLRFIMALNETITLHAGDDDEANTDELPETAPIPEIAPVAIQPIPVLNERASFMGGRAKLVGVPVKAHDPMQQALVKIHEASTSKELPVEDHQIEDIPEFLDDKTDLEIDQDLQQLETLHDQVVNEGIEFHGYQPYVAPNDSLETGVEQMGDMLAKKGLLSAAELRRVKILGSKYTTIPNPYTKTTTLEEFARIDPKETHIDLHTPLMEGKIPGLLDQSMNSSSLKIFDSKYITEIMPRDTVKMVLNLQKAGVAVTDYNITTVEDRNDSFDIHSIKIVPIVGKSTTLKFRMPRVNERGIFKAGGTQYRMRKQRGDVPIRKISPSEVALTSYYNKLFVRRADRAVNNYEGWLLRNLNDIAMDVTNPLVSDMKLSNVFDPVLHLPRLYAIMSKQVAQVNIAGYVFYWDYHAIPAHFPKDKPALKGDVVERVPVGLGKGAVVWLRRDDTLVAVRTTPTGDQSFEELGNIEHLLGIEESKRPVEMAEVEIYSKAIPVGVVLAYHIGLGNLLATLKIRPRRVKKGSSLALTEHEFAVRFEDEVLVFDRRSPTACYIFNGFNRFHRDIKQYSVYHFDKKDVYGLVLENQKIGARYLREIDLMFKMWCDHITQELLEEMHEPTDLLHLLVRACELLEDDSHPAVMDNAFQRDKGYERFSGMLYGELVRAVKGYHARPTSVMASVDLNPESVWHAITGDQTVMPIEESNPIHALKEQEVVVFRGSGGRSARSMTSKSRMYHRNAVGLVSEATTDNSDTATISYLTADPNYTSVRGLSRRVSDKELTTVGATKLVSTSMMLAPGSDRDDPKRTNFVSIQNSQTTHIIHATPLPVRTGYEKVLAFRTDDIYAKTAAGDGVVESVSDKAITVKYTTGLTASYELGRRFGKWSGKTIPHELKTAMRVGQKFKAGALIVYNSNFFALDPLCPGMATFRSSVLARTVLWESPDTFEDSSAISKEFASRLGTVSTHTRTIKVRFDQEIRNLLKVGATVDSDDILCIIHSVSEGNTDLFDEKSLDTLKLLAQLTPRARYTGTIEKIEVLYCGEMEEMSASLKALANKSDQDAYRLAKELHTRPTDGSVPSKYRVDRMEIGEDCAIIRVYITGITGMGVGDKIVFSNQIKSVVGRVLVGVHATEDHKPLDAVFGFLSIAARIANSPPLIGTTSTLMLAATERAIVAYDS